MPGAHRRKSYLLISEQVPERHRSWEASSGTKELAEPPPPPTINTQHPWEPVAPDAHHLTCSQCPQCMLWQIQPSLLPRPQPGWPQSCCCGASPTGDQLQTTPPHPPTRLPSQPMPIDDLWLQNTLGQSPSRVVPHGKWPPHGPVPLHSGSCPRERER